MAKVTVTAFDRLLATVKRRQPRPGARRRLAQPEKAEQAKGVALLRSLGAAVYVLGTRRAGGARCHQCGGFVPGDQGTRQTPGIPDVLAFLPAPRGSSLVGCQLWWEAKRPDGGRASAPQHAFAANCAASGIAHCLGDANALVAWLIAHQYLRPDQVAHERIRSHP